LGCSWALAICRVDRATAKNYTSCMASPKNDETPKQV
jgi:hypothetical protein